MVRSASLASLASVALLVIAPPPAARAADAAKEPGVYWEQSVEMQMAGFSMPAQTHKVCLPKKGLEEPPRSGKDDGKCEMTDVKRSGSRMTWKMKCKDGTTGEGDITSGPDSFDGTMTMHTQGHDATMKMKGKKVGGDCDAGEMKRKVAAMQKQADDAQAQAADAQAKRCEDGARHMQVQLFVPIHPAIPVQCKDATKFCANLETREGLAELKHEGKDGAAKAGKLCKKDVGEIAEKLCAAAAKDQQKGTKYGDTASMEFVFAWCPDLAKTLAKRECAGRKFTALPPAQRDFCVRWAQQGLEAGGAEEPAARPTQASGKYLKSGVPDVDDAPAAKKDKKKKAKSEDDDDEGSSKPKDEDMKSRIMKGIFGR